MPSYKFLKNVSHGQMQFFPRMVCQENCRLNYSPDSLLGKGPRRLVFGVIIYDGPVDGVGEFHFTGKQELLGRYFFLIKLTAYTQSSAQLQLRFFCCK